MFEERGRVDPADLLPEARGDRVPPRGGAPAPSAGGARARRLPADAGRASALLPRGRRPCPADRRADQLPARAPDLHPRGEPVADQRPPEQGRPGDLGLGGDHRRAHLLRQHLGDELRAHARAWAAVRLSARAADDAHRDAAAPPLLQADQAGSNARACVRTSRSPTWRGRSSRSSSRPVLVVAALYAVRARSLALAGRPVPVWRQASFAAGIAPDPGRAGLAAGGARRRAGLGSHGPAPPARRPRRAADRARAHRAAAPAAARRPGPRLAARAEPPGRGAAAVARRPLPVARPGPLPGGDLEPGRARARALLLRRLRDRDVDGPARARCRSPPGSGTGPA